MAITKLETGAALGAASIVLSGAALLASHAPAVSKVRDASPDSSTAADLRTAELTAGTLVVSAGAVAAVLMRQSWPILVALATVGAAIAVYEATLHYEGRSRR
jgi:hypothetical protein